MADTKDKGREEAGIATPAENEKLKHTVELEGDEKGAATTRNDVLDAGVPMLQGDPSEPQGPEDAFGPGDKRGDYSQRVGAAVGMAPSLESVPVEGGGEPITDDDGNVVDYKPRFELRPQVPLAHQRGEVKGEKGGVTT